MQLDGYSLEGQKTSLRRFADREEMEIVGIYEDAGKSGKSIEGRPAFKEILSDIKGGCLDNARVRQSEIKLNLSAMNQKLL